MTFTRKHLLVLLRHAEHSMFDPGVSMSMELRDAIQAARDFLKEAKKPKERYKEVLLGWMKR